MVLGEGITYEHVGNDPPLPVPRYNDIDGVQHRYDPFVWIALGEDDFTIGISSYKFLDKHDTWNVRNSLGHDISHWGLSMLDFVSRQQYWEMEDIR